MCLLFCVSLYLIKMRLFQSVVAGASASHVFKCTWQGDNPFMDVAGLEEFEEMATAFQGAYSDVFRVFANSETSRSWQRGVAKVAAELLDQNRDGVPDDQFVAHCLRQNNAHIAVLDKSKREENYSENLAEEWVRGRVEPIHDRNMNNNIDHTFNFLRTGPNSPLTRSSAREQWDTTLQQVTAVINEKGYACAYPNLYGTHNSLLSVAFDQANGTSYHGRVFGQTYDVTPECDRRCQMNHYLYWGQSISMGVWEKFDWYGVGLDNEPEDSGEGSGTKSISCRDNERISQVQSLGCNIHDLEYNDPILFSLVNNIANHLPNVFPNGRYCPPVTSEIERTFDEEGTELEVTHCLKVEKCFDTCGFSMDAQFGQEWQNWQEVNPLIYLEKYVNVLDTYTVYAEMGVSDENLRYVASIVSNMLDTDQDGVVDDPALKDALTMGWQSNWEAMGAHLVIWEHEIDPHYIYKYSQFTGDSNAAPIVLFEHEIDPRNAGMWGFDKTTTQVLKTFLRFGHAVMDPENFGYSETSKLSQAVQQAMDEGVWRPEVYFSQKFANDFYCLNSPVCSTEAFFAMAGLTMMNLNEHGDISDDVGEDEDGWWHHVYEPREVASDIPLMGELFSNSTLNYINFRPDMHYCPPKDNEPDVTDCLVVEPNTKSGERLAWSNFANMVRVSDLFTVFGDEGVADWKLLYVASNAARMIDLTGDGKADDAIVGDMLKKNEAHIAIFSNNDDVGSYGHYTSNYVNGGWEDETWGVQNLAFLFEDELNPFSPGNPVGPIGSRTELRDRTTHQVLRALHRYGLSEAYPALFGVGCGADTSMIAELEEGAKRGNQAFYRPLMRKVPCSDSRLNLDANQVCVCEQQEYLAHSILTMQGVMTVGCLELEHWWLCDSQGLGLVTNVV